MPFLSLLDDRAKPKGSRDPLGFELVWSHFGRKVVGNLTTITGSIENFTVALLGFYWAHQLHGNADITNRERLIRETFLRYEQVAAYLRYQSDSKEIMGITRVQKNISTHTGQLPIALNAQILSDQASYGLWGLYSSALKETGLIEGSDRKPTEDGEAIARAISEDLDTKELMSTFIGDGYLARDACKRLAPQFLQAIQKEEIRNNLTHVLLRGRKNRNASVQEELFSVTKKLIGEGQLTEKFADNFGLIKSSAPFELKRYLNDIQQVERVLVAANNLFNYLLTKGHKPMSEVLKEIENSNYQYDHLPNILPQGMTRRNALCEINNNLRAGNNHGAVQAVIKLNADVMKARGGAPWVRCENSDILNVKVKSETDRRRSQAELVDEWDYDYFLESFLRIAKANLGVRNG